MIQMHFTEMGEVLFIALRYEVAVCQRFYRNRRSPKKALSFNMAVAQVLVSISTES